MIFKQGIKNYFINLKHFFTPLGVLFLGVLLALTFFVPSLTSTLRNLINNINTINSVEISFKDFQDNLFNSIFSLNFNDSNSFYNLFNTSWIKDILTNAINTSLQEINNETSILINSSIRRATNLLFGSLGFVGLGLVGGYFLTKYLIRKEIAKRALWKFFLISLIDSLISATLVAACLSLLAIWAPSIFLSTLLSLVLFGAISLFEAYLVHGYKRISLKEVLTFKNTGMILLVNLTIFMIATLLVSLITLIINGIIGFCIALPLLEIAFIVISLNAESYVKTIANKNSSERGVKEIIKLK